VTRLGLDGRDSIPGTGWEFYSAPRPDRLWERRSLLWNGYRG